MRRSTFSLALVALALGSASADPPAPIASYPAPSGVFIDDSFALRADGKSIAFVTTDGASPATLHFAELGGAQHEIAGLAPATAAVHWLGPERVRAVPPTPSRLSGGRYSA